MPTQRWTRWWGTLGVSAAAAAGLAGCAHREAPRTLTIPNATLGALTIAVAPALNFSGGRQFDANAIADLMASELSYVEGVKVIPVSRVLAVLARQGRQEIGSPSHALEVAETLGADAILVFAVTEYDPYQPPVVGIAAQLYGFRHDGALGGLDPILVSREARPFGFSPRVPATVPLRQTERVFNAAHDPVVDAVKTYAAARHAGDEVMGWEKYLASQRHYLRYCCHAIIAELAAPAELSEVTVLSVR